MAYVCFLHQHTQRDLRCYVKVRFPHVIHDVNVVPETENDAKNTWIIYRTSVACCANSQQPTIVSKCSVSELLQWLEDWEAYVTAEAMSYTVLPPNSTEVR